MNQGNRVDRDRLDDVHRSDDTVHRGDQAMTQEPVAEADAAERIFTLGFKTRKFRAGRCVDDPYLLARAGLIFMRVPQDCVGFRCQQSPGN